MNNQVRKWGIDIQRVELSAIKVLKQAENSSSTAVGSILKGLGMKEDPEYPTPQEFVRVTYGLPEDKSSKSTAASAANPVASHVSAMGCIPPPEIPEGTKLLAKLQIMLRAGIYIYSEVSN